jgi:general secretion pathway protein K
MTRSGNQQRGVALIIVLWLGGLLAVMLGGFTLMVRNELNLARNQIDIVTARAAAAAGVPMAVHHLLSAAPEQAWPRNGAVESSSFGEFELQLSVVDERGKVDLNQSTREQLTALLAVAGVEAERVDSLTDAILDWRDRDSLRRVNGAEADDYLAAGKPAPGNRAFSDVAELAGVLGMRPEIYARLAPAVTVHSRLAQVMPRFAPLLVRQALEKVAGGTATSSRSQRGSDAYSIYVTARHSSGARASLHAVVRLNQRSGEPEAYRVLSWSEGVELIE